MVTDEQVKLLRRKRMDGKTQEQAAAVAGMCVKTVRGWSTGLLPSERVRERHWRTREDQKQNTRLAPQKRAPQKQVPSTLWLPEHEAGTAEAEHEAGTAEAV